MECVQWLLSKTCFQPLRLPMRRDYRCTTLTGNMNVLSANWTKSSELNSWSANKQINFKTREARGKMCLRTSSDEKSKKNGIKIKLLNNLYLYITMQRLQKTFRQFHSKIALLSVTNPSKSQKHREIFPLRQQHKSTQPLSAIKYVCLERLFEDNKEGTNQSAFKCSSTDKRCIQKLLQHFQNYFNGLGPEMVPILPLRPERHLGIAQRESEGPHQRSSGGGKWYHSAERRLVQQQRFGQLSCAFSCSCI